MESKQQISIIAIHGNGGGGFRFEIAKPLFSSNIDFLNPSLPGFNSTNNHQKYLRHYSTEIKGELKWDLGVHSV